MSRFDENMVDFIRLVESASQSAMQEYGGIIEDRTAQILNTPYPPASTPGETPHRRTGALRAGLSHVTTVEGDLIITEIISERSSQKPGETTRVPGYLNFVMDRPYLTNIHTQLTINFREEIISLLLYRVNR